MFGLILDRDAAHRLAWTFCSLLALSVVLGACADKRESPAERTALPIAAEAGPEAFEAAEAFDAADAAAESPPVPSTIETFVVDDDERAALAAIRAVPAWTAVIDRARYLSRRGGSGAIYGRFSPRYDDQVWLVDETRGDGALGVRIRGTSSSPEAGTRVVLWGAWKVDEERRWYWDVTRAQRLPEKNSPEPTGFSASHPGHEIEVVDRPPPGSVVAEELSRAGGGVYFEVIRGPRRRGDGYVIAGRTRFPELAILKLPGDLEPYGGQDLLSADESWSLKRNLRYVLRVRRWRPARRAGELPVWRAISPPKRLQRTGVKQK